MALTQAKSDALEGRANHAGRATSLSEARPKGKRRQDTLPHLIASTAVRRALRPVAERLSEASTPAVLSVASAQPGEGKTLVAGSLAVMLAETMGKRVLLVDANMESRAVHQLFDLTAAPGLGDCLRGQSKLAEAVSQVRGLNVLPAGKGADSARLLHTGGAKQLLDEMRQRYDLTLIDLPALSCCDEAAALCEWSDGVIMVVRANAVRASTVQQALKMIDSRKLVGVILNREKPTLPGWLRRWF